MNSASQNSNEPQSDPLQFAQVGPASNLAPANELDQLREENRDLRERNEALATAIVNSAEIIGELEQTKRELAAARQQAEQAQQNTQRMAETIFDGTHDAMLVLDQDSSLVSANRNARAMFGFDDEATGIQVKPQLQQRFRCEYSRNWFDELVRASDQGGSRFELYQQDPSLDSGSDCISTPTGGFWIEVSISHLENNLTGGSYLLTAHDITQRKQIEDQFQHQALHDNVTQLPNRRFFVQRIEQLLENADPGLKFSVCFLDLDNFKTVNDTLGHEAGDQLLVQVAHRIKNSTRGNDFLARFGGDEFALLIPNLNTTQVAGIANRIVAELKKPFTINDHSVYVGASIGMTRFPDDAEDVHGLLQNADVAMYSAKENGRNQFHPFTPELAASVQENQLLLADLRNALQKNDIELEYQPKWSLHDQCLTGCEALLRWKRNGQPVPAAHLVEVAECSGLILQLGDLVLQTAIRQMAAWRQEYGLHGRIAVNTSSRQLVDPTFVERFRKIVEAAELPMEAVELEITETAMMKNFNQAVGQIRALKRMGVSIAIDDFGTGYSSLGYLKSFPVSTLKIDRSFVRDLPGDPKAVAVAQAVLSLGHGLGLTVVAEGVENQAQLEFLQAANCDQVQGWLFSRSLPPEQFIQWALSSESRP